MSENRPIEKLLKDYAEKRLSDAGPPGEIHPATRKLLLDEVRRTYPAPAGNRSWFQSLILAWPRLLPALGLFVALGVVTWAMLQPDTEPAGTFAATTPEPASEEAVADKQGAGNEPGDKGATAAPATPGHSQPVGGKRKEETQKPARELPGALNDESPSPSAVRSKTVAPAQSPNGPVSRALKQRNPEPSAPIASSRPLVENDRDNLPIDKNQAKVRMASSDAISVSAPAAEARSRIQATPPQLSQTATIEKALSSQRTKNVSEIRKSKLDSIRPAAEKPFAVQTLPNSVPPPAKAAEALDREAKIWNITTSFTNTSRDQDLSTFYKDTLATNGFLSTFTVLQNNETVQFVDADGSVYTGKLLGAQSLAKRSIALRRRTIDEVADQDSVTRASGRISSATPFNVSGTNLTLNKEIFISGFLSTTNIVISGGKLLQPTPQPLDITGTARFSPTEVIQIKARSVINLPRPGEAETGDQ